MLDKGVHYDGRGANSRKMFIAQALQRTKGNLGIAADMLGLHRNTIARKMADADQALRLGAGAWGWRPGKRNHPPASAANLHL
jgi:hypothetical protein